jgi:phosphatidylserine/phosphatidylglycerophosphate/cardiolipin synthase-like enzyme
VSRCISRPQRHCARRKACPKGVANHIRVIVVTRPIEDFRSEDRDSLQSTLDLFKSNDISVVFKSNIHQKFAIMDQKIMWYGSINLLSYGNAQESLMRIENSNIANELINSIERS